MKVYTPEEIEEMKKTWVNFNGFTGDKCGSCQKTANILVGGGWFCDCGNYVAQLICGVHPTPHESPDMGTPASVIREGYER
jgi:hypothetical protein